MVRPIRRRNHLPRVNRRRKVRHIVITIDVLGVRIRGPSGKQRAMIVRRRPAKKLTAVIVRNARTTIEAAVRAGRAATALQAANVIGRRRAGGTAAIAVHNAIARPRLVNETRTTADPARNAKAATVVLNAIARPRHVSETIMIVAPARSVKAALLANVIAQPALQRLVSVVASPALSATAKIAVQPAIASVLRRLSNATATQVPNVIVATAALLATNVTAARDRAKKVAATSVPPKAPRARRNVTAASEAVAGDAPVIDTNRPPKTSMKCALTPSSNGSMSLSNTSGFWRKRVWSQTSKTSASRAN